MSFSPALMSSFACQYKLLACISTVTNIRTTNFYKQFDKYRDQLWICKLFKPRWKYL